MAASLAVKRSFGFMGMLNGARTALAILLLTTLSTVAAPREVYQKGTIRKGDPPTGPSCDLIDGNKGYEIGNCGEFHGGQVVGYRVKDKKVYIRGEGGKESKCPVTAELSGILDPAAPSIHSPKYQKGTIEGFETFKDIDVSGAAAVLNGGPTIRTAKVYRLRGPDLIYKVDYCGSFQAGQFTPGQEVEYRAAADRLYIRHNNDKEYSCQIKGTLKFESVSSAAAAQPGASSTGSTRLAGTPAASTAKLSVTSIPDGADIEVDGNFSGNTPSDLALPEGQYTIRVKKSGYKDWQRDLKVVGGSNIHLNAEMEKSANP
jgi:PEGA domain